MKFFPRTHLNKVSYVSSLHDLVSDANVSCEAGDCELLGWVGIAVQVAITVVCAIAYIAVWLMESPRRNFMTWIFDISKQVAGSAFGKLYNIAQAIIFAELLRLSSDQQDQCVWYLMGIFIDCFVTTFLCWGANTLARPVLLRRYGIDIGDYGEEAGFQTECHMHSPGSETDDSIGTRAPKPISFKMYLQQLGIWLSIIMAVRLLVSVGLFFTQHEVYTFCEGIFQFFGVEDPTWRLIFAVLIFPALADTFQIVVQDNFLKKHKDQADCSVSESAQEEAATSGKSQNYNG